MKGKVTVAQAALSLSLINSQMSCETAQRITAEANYTIEASQASFSKPKMITSYKVN